MVLFLGNSLCYLFFVFLLLLLYKSKSIIDKSFLEKKIGRLVKGEGLLNSLTIRYYYYRYSNNWESRREGG